MEVQDEKGRKLAARRLPEGAAGIAAFRELIAGHLDQDGDPGQVAVAIETDRGLWVQALVALGCRERRCRRARPSRYGAHGAAPAAGHGR